MILDAKSNLAKLMATENIIVEQKNVPTGYFSLDTRTLVIPILKDELSLDLYDLFIGHEVGHALNTPADGWHDSVKNLGVNRSILNICEDARIEKLIRRKFPGLKVSFIKAYRELLDKDFFGVKDKDLNAELFIDRVNLHTKCGASMGIKFEGIELDLLSEVENAETFEETVIVAKKIQEYMKEELEKQKEKQQKGGSGEIAEDEGESGPSDMNLEETEEMETESGQSDQGVSTDGSEFDSQTDKKFRERERELYKQGREDYRYVNIPNINFEDVTIDYKKMVTDIRAIDKGHKYKLNQTLFPKFRNDSKKVVSYLAKEFEMRKNADQMKRASVSKTGDLNMSRIFSYQFSEDIFKKMTIIPEGKSHGLVLMLDWSASMKYYMDDTVKQLLTLVLFCKAVQIPFEVYAFANRYENPKNIQYKPGDLMLRDASFALYNIFSSRMSNVDLSYMGNALLNKIYDGVLPEAVQEQVWEDGFRNYSLGNTPLNESIITCMDIIPKFKAKNNLQIVNMVFLTDGDGHALIDIKDDAKSGGHYYSYPKFVLRDPVTKVTIKANYRSNDTSSGFLHILKQRTGCNVIGFRILNNRDMRSYLNSFVESNQIDKLADKFSKENSIITKFGGYDENYLIKSTALDTDEEELEIKSTTTRSMVSAFKRYTKGNIQNRVILNHFIQMVA
jgi:hypothetical protein